MKKTIFLAMILLLAGTFAMEGIKVGRLYHPPTTTTYPTNMQAGDQGVYVELQLTNNHIYSYENISTELVLQEPFEGVKTKNFVQEIKPSGQKSIFYKVDVAKDAEPGEYLLEHNLEYYYTELDEDGNPTTYNIEDTRIVSVIVSYSERLEITEIGFSPIEILPSQETRLSLIVKNTGSIAINDIDVSYTGLTTTKTTISTSGATSEEQINFLPLESTKKSLDTLQPGESKEVKFRMRSLIDTTVRAYQMPVTVEYGDNEITENAVVNVKGKPDVRIAGIQIDEDSISEGQQFTLSLQLENVGTGDARSVKAEIVSDNVSGMEESYIGTIEVEDTGTAIFDLRDYNLGKRNIELSIIYEDEYGNIQEDVRVSTGYTVKEIPPDYTIFIVAIIAFFFIIYLIYRKWRKKKELEQLVS